MKYLNEHFKLVEEKLGFPKDAVELFEKIALKIEKTGKENVVYIPNGILLSHKKE